MEKHGNQQNFSGAEPGGVILRMVGIIRSRIKEPLLAADAEGIKLQSSMDHAREEIRETRRGISEIIINDDLMDILDGIEDYSHLVVLYWAHKVPEQSRSLTRVHPMGRKDISPVGIFCTCSPARPNPLLMTVVRLSARNGRILEVAGLDAVDGSPVLDIKPYVGEFYPREEVIIPEWMQRLLNEVRE